MACFGSYLSCFHYRGERRRIQSIITEKKEAEIPGITPAPRKKLEDLLLPASARIKILRYAEAALDKSMNPVCFNSQIVRKFRSEVTSLPTYLTKQRKLLIGFLSAHTDELLSVGQIVEALSDKGI